LSSTTVVSSASFAREYGFFPHACNPASGWEKGKIERAIGYLRQNFGPLREFTDLHDINRQARQWLFSVNRPSDVLVLNCWVSDGIDGWLEMETPHRGRWAL
jgi:hypothetical protein